MEAMAQASNEEHAVEVMEKAKRRQYSAAYKLKILQAADACTKPGEVGALLRREGLYSSHLAAWRKARARGERKGLEAKQRGPKAKVPDPTAIHGRRQIGTTALRRSPVQGAAHASVAASSQPGRGSRHAASIRSRESSASGTVRG